MLVGVTVAVGVNRNESLPLARISQLPENPNESMVPNVLSGGRAGGTGGSVFHQPIHERPWLEVVSTAAGQDRGSAALLT